MDIGKQAISNIPKDLEETGNVTWEAFKHPIDTAEALATVARGGMQHALPDKVANYLNIIIRTRLYNTKRIINP